MPQFTFNPKSLPTQYEFFSEFVSEQITPMLVSDKKPVDLGGKTVVEFRVMIWKLYPKRSGRVYRTKYDKCGKELWVARIK